MFLVEEREDGTKTKFESQTRSTSNLFYVFKPCAVDPVGSTLSAYASFAQALRRRQSVLRHLQCAHFYSLRSPELQALFCHLVDLPDGSLIGEEAGPEPLPVDR